MHRYNFYFKQPVSETEFNGGFTGAEQADWNLFKDRGVYGILSGFVPSAAGGWNLAVSAGFGIDKNGARLYSAGTITLDPRTDTTGASTVPSAGNRRWVGIYARFGRNLTDARTDGLGNPVKFDSAEALNPDDVQAHVGQLLVVAGGQDLVGNPLPARPALDASAILLADILLTDGDSSLVIGKIDSSRAEHVTLPFGWSLPLATEYGGGNTRYFLAMQGPADPAHGTSSRLYFSTDGFTVTNNAQWNPIPQTWSADYTSSPATRTTFGTNGLFVYIRAVTGSPWDDTIDSGTGWDSSVKLFSNSAGQLTEINAGSDLKSKGTQNVHWAMGGVFNDLESDAKHVHISQVQFPKSFAAAPSTVTISAFGMPADVMGVPDNISHTILPASNWTMTISVVNKHPAGATIQALWNRTSGSDAAPYALAERTVIATY